MLWLFLPWFLVAYCDLSAFAMVVETNITVDDTHPSVSYLPARAWYTRTSYYHPIDSAYNRTWHSPAYDDAGLELITMSVNFIGTALYLYSLPGHFTSTASLSYNLDGQPVSSLSTHSTDSPFFAYWNLSNSHHNLIVTVEPSSTFSFDYLIYTTAFKPIPSLLVQARQADAGNSMVSSSQDQSQTSSGSSSTPNNTDSGTQIGAIAGAIAASVGITSLFSVGLAISIIKIRRQRQRIRRERRAENRNRSRGLSIHLPSAPASAVVPHRPSHLPRYSPDTTAAMNPPSYDTVMRLTGRNSVVLATLGQAPYVTLATISEVGTDLSSPPSIVSHREPSVVREDSLEGMSPPPPGLGESSPLPIVDDLVDTQTQSGTLQHPGVRSDHDA